MTLADIAEREASRMRADLDKLEPDGVTDRDPGRRLAACDPQMLVAYRLRAMLAAYDERPPCPLTPVVIGMVSETTGASVDCGWHMVAMAYWIRIRLAIGDRQYASDRFVSGLEISEAFFAQAIWTRETCAVIDDVRHQAGIGSLTLGQTDHIGRCVSEQAKAQAAARRTAEPAPVVGRPDGFDQRAVDAAKAILLSSVPKSRTKQIKVGRP